MFRFNRRRMLARLGTFAIAAPSVGRALTLTSSHPLISDHLATSHLMSVCPLFCTQGADGTIWRIAPDSEGLIPVSAAGIRGWNSAADIDFTVNHQPALAQALAYQQSIGAKGLRFDATYYSIWCPWRKGRTDNPNADQTGFPFVINGPTIFQSAPQGTTFIRRKWDGSDPAIFANTQILPSNWVNNGNTTVWRGGMFFLVGRPGPADKDYESLTHFTLRGIWTIDGGLLRSNAPGVKEAGNPPWYVLTADGSGWDVSDKAIWLENDRRVGDLHFEGLITIRGFRGELIYQGGPSNGSVYQKGLLRLMETDGDAFNPGPGFSAYNPYDGGTLQMEELYISSAFNALEGSAGWGAYIGKITIGDCNYAGGLMGGCWITCGNSSTKTSLLHIKEIKVIRGNVFNCMGRLQIDTFTAIDCEVGIGQFNMDAADVNIDTLIVVADRKNVQVALSFCSAGQKAGARSTYNDRVGRLILGQTPFARVKGYHVRNPVSWVWSLGDNIRVDSITGVAAMKPTSAAPWSVLDMSPQFGSISLKPPSKI